MTQSRQESFQHTQVEAVSAVYSRLPGSLIVSLINAILIVIVLEDGRWSDGPLLWLGCIVLLTLVRAAILWRYRSDGRWERNARFWAICSVASSLCAGSLWGAGPLISQVSSYQWLWAFAIGGMCAGAASLNSSHLPTALSFIFPAALPLAISLLLEQSLQGTAAAIMTIAFIGVTTFTAVLFSRDFGRMQALHLAVKARAAEVADTNRLLSDEIANHKSTSEALYQSQKMEALGSLTGGFAHDFNNILTVIISNLEQIARDVAPSDRRELTRSAIGAAESGADLISRLLAFARKQTLTPQHCNVVAVVREFQELLQHAVSGSTSVRFDLPATAIMAKFDVTQFQAMLLNLVVNARDAMREGGVIGIAVTVQHLDQRILGNRDIPPGEFVAVAVSDNGTGMTQETIERAFEPFFTTKGERGGTGLGLAQVYGFARQSGGLGHIESKLGRGSRVTIFVPLAEPVPDTVLPETIAEPAVRQDRMLSVLLVDDNLTVLRSLESGLKEEQWAVHCVTSAAAAIEVIGGGGSFDIVVSDVDMPGGMNGEDLAKILQDSFSLPVLLMSGAPVSSRKGCLPVPMIAKPFRKAALLQRIEEVIQGAAR